ncbi:MAG: rod shape-determining protein MreC [Bacteriovoracaceae bacterium]|nr:rod shape-determining protein MreC [Bacteriovoracaceae bacterium]
MKIGLDQTTKNKAMSYILVTILSFSVFITSSEKMEGPSFIKKLIVESIGPLQGGTATIKRQFWEFVDNYLNIVDTRKENEFLRYKISELSQENFSLKSLSKENDRLKSLLAFGDQIKYQKILSQVIGWNSTAEFKVLRIDKGSNQGIVPRSAVITSEGLVGYTYVVYPNYTDILTILDPNNRVDVVVERTRTHAILEGFSDQFCRMKFVPRTEALVVGDLVISAGFGKLYPKGIKTGTVEVAEHDSVGITQKIKVRPAVDFEKLEEVVILIRPALPDESTAAANASANANSNSSASTINNMTEKTKL